MTADSSRLTYSDNLSSLQEAHKDNGLPPASKRTCGETLHRQLKGALKPHETEKWTTVLPIILMGIRAAWREDLKWESTAAGLVYGEPIRLPGQFLVERPTSTIQTS